MIVRVADERLPEGKVVMPGIVLRITETPGSIAHSGGEMGAVNHAIYHGLLGLSTDEISCLQVEGVI